MCWVNGVALLPPQAHPSIIAWSFKMSPFYFENINVFDGTERDWFVVIDEVLKVLNLLLPQKLI